jgi:hypothetical protein
MGRRRPHVITIKGHLAACALAIVAFALVATPATAAIRTGSSTVQYPAEDLSTDFPGMSAFTIRYEDSDGSIDLSAMLRSPLADSQATSALRKTAIEVRLGDFYGSDMFSDSCESFRSGLTVTLSLGDSAAYLDLGDPFQTSDDLKVPLIVSDDRLTVSAHVPPDPRVGPRNIICAKADLTGAHGMATDAPQDFTSARLLDGFDGRDGNIGMYAEDDTLSQFRYIHNSLTDREKDTLWDYPGWRATCTPQTGSVIVTCSGQGRIPSLVGRPLVKIRGDRTYELVRAKDMFGIRGDMLRWYQDVSVRVSWSRCPRAIDTTRAKRKQGCEVPLRWKTGKFLPQELAKALILRARRTGTPPAKRKARAGAAQLPASLIGI